MVRSPACCLQQLLPLCFLIANNLILLLRDPTVGSISSVVRIEISSLVCVFDVYFLRERCEWAEGRDERTIYWLSGLAGTGISMITRTVARKQQNLHDALRHLAKHVLSHPLNNYKLQVAPQVTPLKHWPTQSIANRDSWEHLIFPTLGIKMRFQGGVTKVSTLNYSRGWGG